MKKKKIPKFNNEAEERLFWQNHDSSEYIDWSEGEEAIFSKLKPSTRTISIRLPESMIEKLKLLANRTLNVQRGLHRWQWSAKALSAFSTINAEL